MRSCGWILILIRIDEDTYTKQEKPCGNGEKMAISKPKREASEKWTLLTRWSWTFILQNYQKRNFCCLNYPVCSTLLKTLSNEYYKDTHHRIFLIAAQDKNISVQQWRHCSFHTPVYLYVLRRKYFTWFLFFFFAKFWFYTFLNFITLLLLNFLTVLGGEEKIL